MNYYAQGGQAHGIKSLAQELPKYGRYNDDMVAHISSDEARLLKSLGGSGTINPVTGLPEFGLGSIIKSIVKPVQQVYNATLKNIPGVDQALVGLDKGIGSIIPGGWGTLASIAGSAVGLPTWALTGLGGLTGSGVLKKDGKFNLQGALMGGAMAYGASQLGEAARAAGDVSGGYNPSAGLTSAAEQTAASGSGDVFAGLAGQAPQASADIVSPSLYQAAQSNIDPSVLEGMTREAVSSANVLPSVANAPAPGIIEQGIANLKSTGQGIANLSGFAGPEGTAAAARAAAVGPITQGGMTALAMGTLGTMQLDEQQKALDAQLASGNIAQSEYDAQAARIADARARAEQAVRENPYQFAKGGEVPGYFGGGIPLQAITPDFIEKLMSPEQRAQSQGKQLTDMGIKQNIVDSSNATQLQDYINAMRKSEVEKSAYRSMINNPYQYAAGGSIDDEYGMDEARGLMQGNLQNGFMGGGMPSYARGGNVSTPRFLSGGGDGMSDSIPATINGKQEARLADGEFVVPADVVSHLGNGSSKAGAKRLYSMMDKVRSARTGTKKQAPAINTNRLMPA